METGQKGRAGRFGEGQPSTRGCGVFKAGPWPLKGHTGSGTRSEPVNYVGVILGPTYHAPAWVTPPPPTHGLQPQ